MYEKRDTTHGYFPVDNRTFDAGFHIIGAGTEHIAPNHPYPNPMHPEMYQFSWSAGRVLPEYQLVYIHRGRGEFESSDTGKVHVRSGMAMILLPGVWHRYRPNPKTGWLEYWISFDGQLPHLWQRSGIISPHCTVRTIGRRSGLEKKLAQLIELAVNKPTAGVAASFSALAILANVFAGDPELCLTPVTSDTLPELESGDPVVSAALNIIWNYSHRNLSVGRIAQEIGVTRRTLERRFRRSCGRTVLDESTACRLSRAQRLLKETHLPVKRIASVTGFSDATYMATVFRKKLGVTPQQYRFQALAGKH